MLYAWQTTVPAPPVFPFYGDLSHKLVEKVNVYSKFNTALSPSTVLEFFYFGVPVPASCSTKLYKQFCG